MDKIIKDRIDAIRRGEAPEGYCRTRAGYMPDEWDKKIHAKDVFMNYTNKRHGGNYEVLSATQERGIIPRSEVDIDIKYDESNIDTYKKVNIGDFIISLRSFQGGIEYSTYEGLVSPAYTVLKNKLPIDTGYYKAYFKTTDFIRKLNGAIYGIRDGKQIGFGDFGDLAIHYPPLSEQQKISEILDHYDKLINLCEAKVNEYKSLKKTWLRKMFPQNGSNVPEIRFPGFSGAWEQHKFGEMFERRTERNLGQFDNTKWISVAKMYYQSPDKVTSNNIDTRTYVLRKGDIAFEGHPNAEYKYGRFVEDDIGDGVISELFPIYRHLGEYDLNYWKYAIQIESIMAPKLLRCIEISYTSSNKLDEGFFLKESILVPSLEEQRKIGGFFRQLDNTITLHEREVEEYTKLKKAMTQLLLTGIVRVK